MFSLTTGIPQSLVKLLSGTEKLLARCNRINHRFKALEDISKKNYKSVPDNATIREERIKCGKPFCVMCPHGPYYYAYWKENGKLKKKYIGTKYDEVWRRQSKTGSKH
jgi:hypothetical protein